MLFIQKKILDLHMKFKQITILKTNIMKSLSKIYKITETQSSFIFQNDFNIYIELNKIDGTFITGNVYDNEQTQVLFKKLYKIATK